MVDLHKCQQEQKKLAKKIILKDEFDPPQFYGGVSAVSSDNTTSVCIVVCDEQYKVIESVEFKKKSSFPVLKGYRAYREGPVVAEAYSQLKQKPDILFFAGNGIIHPQGIGLASHIGVLLDQPSLGVSKYLTFGEKKESAIFSEGKKIGQAVVTKEHARPVYVSPGHRLSLKTAVSLVKKTIVAPHKMPEPIHLAHKQAKKLSKSDS